MEEFILLSKKNTPYKVYKRKYSWSPQDVMYNVLLLPYYNKFLEIRNKTLELHMKSKNSKTTEEKTKAVTAIRNFRLNSRRILGEIKNECKRN